GGLPGTTRSHARASPHLGGADPDNAEPLRPSPVPVERPVGTVHPHCRGGEGFAARRTQRDAGGGPGRWPAPEGPGTYQGQDPVPAPISQGLGESPAFVVVA